MPRRKQKLPKHVRAHGAGYRAVVTVDGKRIRSRTFPTVTAVESWLDLVLAARSKMTVPPSTMTLGECMATLRTELAEVDARPGTLSFYESHAPVVINGLGGDKTRIDLLTTPVVQSYVNARRIKGVKGSTIVGKELMILRRFLKIAREAGVALPIDCLNGLRTPTAETKRFGYLTARQVANAAAAMRTAGGDGPYWADITEMLFQTGMRRAELVRLRVADIDFEQQHIEIIGKRRHRNQVFGKGMVPVLERAVGAAQSDGRIVESMPKVRDAFTKWKKRLKLRHFSPHVLRHGYGTAMAPKVSPWKLMALMDHSTIKQTETYYHSTDAGMRDALDDLAADLQEPQPPQQTPPPPPE